MKHNGEQDGVDDVTKVKQIIQNQPQLPVPTVLKTTRLGEKKSTTQNSVTRYQPLLIQLPESEIALKKDRLCKCLMRKEKDHKHSFAMMYPNGLEQLVVFVNLSKENQKTN